MVMNSDLFRLFADLSFLSFVCMNIARTMDHGRCPDRVLSVIIVSIGIVCKICSDKRLINFGVNVPKRWFGYLSSYSSAIPFEGIGISSTLYTTMDRRILGLFSSTLLPKNFPTLYLDHHNLEYKVSKPNCQLFCSVGMSVGLASILQVC
ncbi:hypothetical protein RDI58_028311 [Solanum bulbocastanum]|uniref:Uncharacterized protein n=1 Tax=Solanum bulbocastanum TaxID=147425 RepID=A0AAN8SQ20_SOLBU